MGFIQKIVAQHKEKVKVRNDACDNLIAQVDTALQEIKTIDAFNGAQGCIFYVLWQ